MVLSALKKLDVIDHLFGSEHRCEHSQFSKAFPDRIAFLVAVYDTIMDLPFFHPSGRNPKKVRVVGEDGRLFFAGVDQLLFIASSQVAHLP